ncbi:hypothetical protein CBM2634_B170446 [Cupriavidus taiwanensis]|uniref:Uncharacterized protein n=2 Tax=Cupriavidus taiwanensis TaxID=164546 RepID=A0A375J8C4_9BURK|nr:hypothetical protein CBM2634_B170446 [Cupriavidus taiwanensis]
MRFDGYAVHVLNASIVTPLDSAAVEGTLAAPLMKLAATIPARVAREA